MAEYCFNLSSTGVGVVNFALMMLAWVPAIVVALWAFSVLDKAIQDQRDMRPVVTDICRAGAAIAAAGVFLMVFAAILAQTGPAGCPTL